MNTPLPSLFTDRLVLRPFVLSDAPRYFSQLASSREVTRYMLFRPHQDIAESYASMEKIQRLYAEGNCFRWAVARKDHAGLIGTVALLSFDAQDESCSFAYMFGKDYWGRGYASEALKAVFGFAFDTLSVSQINADHFIENAASGAVMRKVGMTFVQRLPEKYEKDGIRHDADLYRITKEEWYQRSRG